MVNNGAENPLFGMKNLQFFMHKKRKKRVKIRQTEMAFVQDA